MRRNPAIGIASGDVHILKNGKRHNIKVHGDYPSGTARIWKKKCFYQTDGYDLTIAPDSVSRIKAILKGWKTVRFPNIQALQLRETSSAEGFWKGYLIQGEASHHLGYPLLLVIARAMYCLIQPRFYLVIPYLIGYLESSIRKKPRIQDKEIIYYFKKRRLYELLSNWF